MIKTSMEGNKFAIEVEEGTYNDLGNFTYSEKYKRYYLNSTIKTLKGKYCNISFKVYLTEEQAMAHELIAPTKKYGNTNTTLTMEEVQALLMQLMEEKKGSGGSTRGRKNIK